MKTNWKGAIGGGGIVMIGDATRGHSDSYPALSPYEPYESHRSPCLYAQWGYVRPMSLINKTFAAGGGTVMMARVEE